MNIFKTLHKKVLITICSILLINISGLFAYNINELERQCYYYNRKATTLIKQKEYKKAEAYYTKTKLLLEENSSTRTGLYIKTITSLGKLYYDINDNVGYQNVSNILENLLDTDFSKLSKRGISLFINIAQYYAQIDEVNKADHLLEKLLDISTRINSPEAHARFLHVFAFTKYSLGDIHAAIQYERMAIECYKLPESYKSLCWYYYVSKDIESLQNLISEAFIFVREPALQRFVKSNRVERSQYWVNAGVFFNRFIPQFALDYPTEELRSITYDAILLSKGMLLNADITTADIIKNSGDELLIADYNRFNLLSNKVGLTLEEEADKALLQELIVKKQKQYTNKFRSKFRYSWKEIQGKLKDNDVAVEFISVGNSLDNEYLVALVVDKLCTSPYLIKLCSINELSNIPSNDLYTTPILYNLVWEPIFNQIGTVENIYFSPTSVLHNIAIEYSLDNDEMELLSMYNIYRLSSTRQIIEMTEKYNYEKCLLLGGVNYNDSLVSAEVSVSGGVKYLPATKAEVDTINRILERGGNIQTKILYGNDGNEFMVKKIGSSNNDIIHLATHGFYIPLSRDVVFPSLNSLVSNSLIFNSEDKENFANDMNLTHTGLLLANANNTLLNTNREESDDMDDGILFASELATIELKNTDLLVLSACETALGDLSFSEGVFGLQRGYKLAGGKSIIMSLWEVDDTATMLFMSSLYNNLKTMQLNEAFYSARMDLRMLDDGKWDNPKFYNAFILLDSL